MLESPWAPSMSAPARCCRAASDDLDPHHLMLGQLLPDASSSPDVSSSLGYGIFGWQTSGAPGSKMLVPGRRFEHTRRSLQSSSVRHCAVCPLAFCCRSWAFCSWGLAAASPTRTERELELHFFKRTCSWWQVVDGGCGSGCKRALGWCREVLVGRLLLYVHG